MSSSDRDDIRLSLDGHPEAFGRLVERYEGPLLSYLTGRLGDKDRAEEVAQEAFVRSFSALRTLKKPESFFPWLFGVADRVLKEQYRAEVRHAKAVRSLAEETSTAPTGHDLDLERAVAELDEPYRQVVLLRYYGGMSCDEVAQRLGVPLGTVTKQLSRAYVMLRGSLSQADRKTNEVKP
jgi:RNA polymerase sigma-70 factor (ECF subfamily)